VGKHTPSTALRDPLSKSRTHRRYKRIKSQQSEQKMAIKVDNHLSGFFLSFFFLSMQGITALNTWVFFFIVFFTRNLLPPTPPRISLFLPFPLTQHDETQKEANWWHRFSCGYLESHFWPAGCVVFFTCSNHRCPSPEWRRWCCGAKRCRWAARLASSRPWAAGSPGS